MIYEGLMLCGPMKGSMVAHWRSLMATALLTDDHTVQRLDYRHVPFGKNGFWVYSSYSGELADLLMKLDVIDEQHKSNIRE